MPQVWTSTTLPTRATSQIQQLLKPVVNTLGKPYAAWLNNRLSAYGLRYDDLYDPLKDEVGGGSVWAENVAGVVRCKRDTTSKFGHGDDPACMCHVCPCNG